MERTRINRGHSLTSRMDTDTVHDFQRALRSGVGFRGWSSFFFSRGASRAVNRDARGILES